MFLLILAVVAVGSNPAGAGDAVRPNIVFILIDDLGWMDLACQGNPVVRTPNVDRLAGEGMRFTDAYAAAPVCSPTRAAIMTGLAPARLHITNHLPERASFVPDAPVLLPALVRDHLPLEHVTVAEHLRDAGYATAFMGKWHLSRRDDETFRPEHQGFDVNLGGCSFGGPPTFFDPYRIPTLPDRTPGEYLPERLADEAIAFIGQQREDPFVLFLWNYTVHWPMEAPAELLAKYADHTGPGLNDPRYGAMIEGMDRAIGRVLQALQDLGVADETLVVFTSDNGAYGGVGDNRPLRKDKGHLYEGGIRVPLIVRWPGVVEPGTTCGTPVVSMDFFPTLLEVACVATDVDPLDGESLVPLLSGRGGLERDAIFFHYPNYAFHRGNRLGSAVRSGGLKLIEYFDDHSVELFDLWADPGETTDVSSERSEEASALRARLARWRTAVGAAMPRPVGR